MKNFWINFFLVLCGIVIGSIVSDMTSTVSWLRWLSYGLTFGTTSPLAVNLNVISFTLGVSINITLATIIFVALSVLLGRLIIKR